MQGAGIEGFFGRNKGVGSLGTRMVRKVGRFMGTRMVEKRGSQSEGSWIVREGAAGKSGTAVIAGYPESSVGSGKG